MLSKVRYKYFLFVSITFSLTRLQFSQPVILADPWIEASEIINRINVPYFPEEYYEIESYGAVGDGMTDCTEAIKLAITDCSKNGGGYVLVSEGEYLTGPVYLKSNVNLFISENAILKFSTDPEKYLPVVFTRWEGVECMNYSPLIYAYGEENIAITGFGVLDGQSSNSNWWSWKGSKEDGWNEGMPNQKQGRNKLFEMAENNIPPKERIFGDGYYLRPSMFQPYNCKNILVDEVTFKNSPMWFVNPVLCENVTVSNIKIEGLGPNNDGCNPESSKNVVIDNCFFNTGDDCIAIKSGRNNDGRRVNVSCENIVIKNCEMKEGHGGVVIGSEISGSVKNVFVENCTMSSPNLERAIRIKTNSIRGGVIENIFVRNLIVGEVSEAVLKIDFYYEEGDAGEFIPEVKNIVLEKVESQKSQYAIWIKAYNRSPVQNLSLKECRFVNVKYKNVMENVVNPQFDNVLFSGDMIDAR